MKKTVKIPKSRIAPPIDFCEVMRGGEVCGIRLDYREYEFMQFENGKVVLFDAYSSAHGYSAFDVDFGVVAFPFCALCMTDAGERVAYCGLRFSEEKIAEWRLLCSPAALGRLVADPDAASVTVSSGVCCIADERAYKAYAAHVKDEIHPLSGHIILNGQTHTVIELFGGKYAVFSSGWGDGRYRCYAGYTEDGRPVAMLVDFGMIEYPKRGDGSSLVEVEIDVEDGDTYVYDPDKSARENDIARWSNIIATSENPTERLRAYSRRGYMYHSVNDVNAALADYTAAVRECKNVTERGALLRAWSVFDNAAGIYCQRSDYESAIKLMIDALAVGDDFYAGAYVRLIDLYLLTKRADEARDIAERMIKKRPDDPVAHMKAAECAVSAMDYETAAREYDVLAVKFRLYENLFDEAACLIELGEYEKADAALERHPAHEYSEQYMYYKAYLAYKQRRYGEAIEYAERAYNLDPEYMPALYLLIDLESLVQEYHAVARYAEEYIKLRPDHEYGYSVCAEAHLILGVLSESARKYYYLYKRVKTDDDKYAALAAITAAGTGNKKRGKSILRALKRKHSAYLSAATYAVRFNKFRGRADALKRMVLNPEYDADFLLQLAVFLSATGGVLPATRILEFLSGEGEPTFEVVAQQIRAAERIGDRKLFDSFLSFYLDKFIGGTLAASERRALSERFMRDPKRRADWFPQLAVLAEKLEQKRTKYQPR